MKTMLMRHNNLRAHTTYYLDEEVMRHGFEPLEISFGNTCGRSSSEIFHEFSDLHEIRPDTKNPVMAFVLSLSPGEICNAEQWNLIIREFFRQMGASPNRHLWFGVRHGNTSQDHVHLEISRVSFSGKLWNPRYELIKAALVTAKLEKMFNLIPTTPMVEIGQDGKLIFNNKSRKRKPTRAMMTEAGLQETALERIQSIIDKLLKFKNGIKKEVFENVLRRNGIVPIAYIVNNELSGYRFTYKRHSFKGSELGTDYRIASLISRGLIIDQAEHLKETCINSPRNMVTKKPTSHKREPEKIDKIHHKLFESTISKRATERARQKFYKKQPVEKKINTAPVKKQDSYEFRESALISGALDKEMKSHPSTADKRYVKMALKQHTKFSKAIAALDHKINWKELDIAIIKKLLTHGFNKAQIVNAIKRHSPEAVKSDKGKNEYAEDLVKEAIASMPKNKKGTNYSNNNLSM